MKYTEKQSIVSWYRQEDNLLNILRIMLPSARIPNVFSQRIVTIQVQSNPSVF